MRNVRLGLPLVLLFFTLGAGAQQPFRAALSGLRVNDCGLGTVILDHTVEWLDPTRRETNSDIRSIASDGNDHVFGLVGSGLTIMRLQPDGTRTPFYQDLTASAEPFAVGGDGRVFVPIQVSGSFFLAVISPAGVREATYPLPIAVYSPHYTAVASDNCTLFYGQAADSAIRRFNACTGTPLPDLVVSGPVMDVDPLANGQILVAEGLNANLYAANGGFIRTVASLPAQGSDDYLGQVGQIAVDRIMRDVWISTLDCEKEGVLLRVQFNSGAEMSRTAVEVNVPNALVLGSVNAATSDVPFGTNALLLLAVALAAVAVFRL